VGLYAYPGKGQSHDQQLIDESDSHNSAQQQIGVNADTPAPLPPSSAAVQAAQVQAAATKRCLARYAPGMTQSGAASPRSHRPNASTVDELLIQN